MDFIHGVGVVKEGAVVNQDASLFELAEFNELVEHEVVAGKDGVEGCCVAGEGFSG